MFRKPRPKFTPEEKMEIQKEFERLTEEYNERQRKRIEEYWNRYSHLIAQFPPSLSGPILLQNCEINESFAIFKLNQPISKSWYVCILLYGKDGRGLRKRECFKIISPEGQPKEYSNYFVIRNVKKDKFFEERMLKFFRRFHMRKNGLEAVALVLNRKKEDLLDKKEKVR